MCTDGIIGYKACGGVFKFYLDNYGLSLQMASKVNDEKFSNAKAMLDTFIQQSWNETFADILFDGLDASKILNDVTHGYMDKSGHFTGTKQIDFAIYKYCELGVFYLSQLKVYVKTGGATTINLIQGTTTTELFNATTTANQIIDLSINDFVEDFSIQIITAGEIYTGVYNFECRNEAPYYTYTDTTYPCVLTFQVRCSKQKHLCKYVADIAPVVINKIMGKVWFKIKTTDVFNNYINSEKDSAVAMMIYYDSQYFGMSDADPASRMKGQYQLTLEKLQKSLPKPTCKACMECKGIGWRYSSMKP